MARRVKLSLQAAAVLVVALLVGLLGWRVLQQEESRSLAAGRLAPDFSLESLDGEETISLSDYRGKVVVLNFWASWCVPCKAEAPRLQEAWERHGDDGVVVLGVDAQDFRSDAQGFVDRFGLTYPIVFDGRGSTLGRYGLTGFPETWFVGRDGRLVGERVSGELSQEQLDEGIAGALSR